jgi:hypothetical protein
MVGEGCVIGGTVAVEAAGRLVQVDSRTVSVATRFSYASGAQAVSIRRSIEKGWQPSHTRYCNLKCLIGFQIHLIDFDRRSLLYWVRYQE